MIKIYKNKRNQLECHVDVGGYDFKFQIDRESESSATFYGFEQPDYNKFEENLDEHGIILGNIHDIMFELTDSLNWEVLFEDGEREE